MVHLRGIKSAIPKGSSGSGIPGSASLPSPRSMSSGMSPGSMDDGMNSSVNSGSSSSFTPDDNKRLNTYSKAPGGMTGKKRKPNPNRVPFGQRMGGAESRPRRKFNYLPKSGDR